MSGDFSTHSYQFPITDEYIAQHPAEKRDASWLMVLDRVQKTWDHKHFSDITDYLNPGDLLVFNNTKVIPARLLGKKTTGANCELLLLRDLGNDEWEVLARPGRRLKTDDQIVFGDNELTATIIRETEFGGRVVRFTYAGVFFAVLDKLGFIPLPPYIKQGAIQKSHSLAERYQTVFAAELGAAAAPTAGLHFTEELLEKLKTKGVQTAEVTLHTGLGTFRPIGTGDIRDHEIHSEWYSMSPAVIEQIRAAKKAGKRVIAVGTTVVRVLETARKEILADMLAQRLEGFTDIYIYPGYSFGVIDAMITNFHLPMSTLLVLVAAFAGKQFVLDAYYEALKKKYRFYSFGDAMLIV
jgi:S-adenosylmethionine:tRNA ribosyltransferase-isomerase